MVVIRTGIKKILVRIANREEPESCCVSRPIWQVTSVQNFRTFTVSFVTKSAVGIGLPAKIIILCLMKIHCGLCGDLFSAFNYIKKDAVR